MTERAVLLDSIHPAAGKAFIDSGIEVVTFPKSAPSGELADMIGQATILGVRSGPEITADMIHGSERLQAIGVYSVGYNHVDLQAASERGIAVFNAPNENTRSVAEYVMAATASLFKRMQHHNRSMHNGVWSKTEAGSYEMRGKTMGIVGHGTVGNQVAVLAQNNDMDVIWYDPNPRIGHSIGRAERADTLEELLERSDVVTLHVPGGRLVIDRKAIFDHMKKGSYLVNAARGDVADYEALAEALEQGHLAGVALDVFEHEPAKQGDAFDHPLRGMEAVVLTPHQAGSTQEAHIQAGINTTGKLLGYLATGKTLSSVNLPELDLKPPVSGDSRILHIHQNEHGVMAGILGVIAAEDLNIRRQSLETRGGRGYAAVDVEGTLSDAALDNMRQMATTLRLKTLSS